MNKNLALLLALTLAGSIAHAASTIDTTNEYAWGANIGWTNWRPDFDSTNTEGVNVNEFVCAGYVYAANVGWINMGSGSPADHIQYQNNSATDFGVNCLMYDKEYTSAYETTHSLPSDAPQAGYALLRGYAYGANIGWINFEPIGNPRISLFTGALSGYAYSANCGWINLNSFDTSNSPTQHYVQTDHILMGSDSNSNGIADAWEYLYYGGLLAAGAQNTSPNGNGMTLLQDYDDGVSPLVSNANLRVVTYATNAARTNSTVTFTSTTARLYDIVFSADVTLPLASWSESNLGLFAPDAGTSTTRTVTEAAATREYFRVKTTRPLP
jgi:hypothetical protein